MMPQNALSTPSRRSSRRVNLTPSFKSVERASKRLCLTTKDSLGSVSTPKSKTPSLLRPSTLKRTPHDTPCKGENDRFIPSRRRMNLDLCRRSLLLADKKSSRRDTEDKGDNRNDNRNTLSSASKTNKTAVMSLQQDFRRHMLSTMCHVPIDSLDENCELKAMLPFGDGSLPERRPVVAAAAVNPNAVDVLSTAKFGNQVMNETRHLEKKTELRKIDPQPYRVLNAPDVVSDFYSDLMSWSEDNIIAVAMASTVYLWSASTGETHLLGEVERIYGRPTCLEWCRMPGRTHLLAIGTSSGYVFEIDASTRQSQQLLRTYDPIFKLSWNRRYGLLSCGGSHGHIYNVDMRNGKVSPWLFQEDQTSYVCGLSWSTDGTCLASGRNDDIICLWDVSMSNSRDTMGDTSSYRPRSILKEHTAAVKALDWCPFQRHVLASGGGLRDQTIKIWNTVNGTLRSSSHTGSQVSSVLWSRTNLKELYSGQGLYHNHVAVWNCSSMTLSQTLFPHDDRILAMDMSPDGSSLASLGADETVRLWDVGAPRSDTDELCFSGIAPSFGAPSIR